MNTRRPDPQNKHSQNARVSRPWQLSLRAWLSIIGQVRRQVLDDHIVLISAGIAFLDILALFPAFSALLSLYGLSNHAHCVDLVT